MFTHNELIEEMPRLKKFAYKLCRAESQADDLLQSTLLRALDKNELFENGTSLFSWTSKIMYNLFVSAYNRRVKFESQYDPEDYIQYQKRAPRQEQQMELQKVQEAMNMLSDKHRTILVLVCIKGMKYTEVANTLNIPVGTVRSRLYRARDQLREMLNGEDTLIYRHKNDDSPLAFKSAA